MVYLFIGENTAEKHEQIAGLKAKWLSVKDALRFDYEVLYGHHLGAKDLKKTLLSLPAIAPQRFLVIHEAEKINDQGRQILADFIASKATHAIIVLDCVVLPDKDAYWQQIREQAKVFEAPKTAKENVFDLTRKMLSGRSAEALQVLNRLFDEGIHPLQIMGGVVWAWGKERERLSAQRFEKGLRDLAEADLNIKRSRLKPEQALEVLVVKLADKNKN